MNKNIFTSIFIVGIIMTAYLSAEADNHNRLHSVPFNLVIASQALADDGYPYGRSKKGRYGEKLSVMNENEALTILKDYFKDNAVIGKVTQKKFYFEAEIKDKQGNLIDRVIIDKRSGRIRSVF